MYENLKAKYNLTYEEIDAIVRQIDWGKMHGDVNAIVAVCDLCCNGDIKPKEE